MLCRPEGKLSESYPFSAIVGQSHLKHSLLMVTVDPTIGGVLIMGDRGTGKSTAIRALAQLLPKMAVTRDCRYNCAPTGTRCSECVKAERAAAAQAPVPMVDLPLGVSEDRLVGALDLERALGAGEKAFEPGLLAKANRGFLYIDEVNLLEDHLVDLLLDVAASGENVVERDGLSIRHPARFLLIGSGNPEEGELRPQFLDRFGLSVTVTTPSDIAERIEIVRRRDAFDRDPAGFVAQWKRKDAAVRRKIEKAQAALASVEVPDAALELAARLCIALGTDGLRGELVIIRAARAMAALDGDAKVTPAHVRAVAPMALGHRLRRDPLDGGEGGARIERALADIAA
jgi:magnesium chelatase subunit I